MSDILLFISSLLKLGAAPAALVIWRKRTGSKLSPFAVGVVTYMVIAFVRGVIRLCLPQDDAGVNFLMQAVVTSVLEEGGRYLAFVYIIKESCSRENAVTYGIGHSLPECLGAAAATLNLFGTHADMSTAVMTYEGALGILCGICISCAMSVFIYFGICRNKTIYVLPAAIIIHIALDIVFIDIIPYIIAALFICFGAYKLYGITEEN